MSIKHPKTKGKNLENKVQKILQEHFNVDDRIIKRNVSSGTQYGENGDINIVDREIEKIFPYIIECKNQEKWSIRDIIGDNINKKSNIFIKFWEQIKLEEENYKKRYKIDKKGILIFSKQRYPIYVMIRKKDLLQKYENLNYIKTKINNVIYLIFEINDFLQLMDRKQK